MPSMEENGESAVRFGKIFKVAEHSFEEPNSP